MINENELPQNWKIVKVGDICDVVRGGSPRPAGDPKYYGGNIPFLKVADLTKDSNVYLQTYQYTIKEAGLHKTRKVSPNTLLLTNSGATLGVPKICMIDATFNDGIAAFLNLEPKSNLYLYYFWLTKTKSLRNINQGAAQPNLNTDIIKNVEIPLPPLAEQERIVAKIEELFSELDAGLESLKTAQAQLKTYRQAVLKYAFEGKLTNDNLNEGELPKGWKLKKIREIAEINPKIPNRESIFDDLEIQFLPMKLVEEVSGITHLSEARKYGEVKKGYTQFIDDDIVFAKVTPCMENGKIAVVQNLKNGIGAGSTEFHVIRSKDQVLPQYIFNFLVQEKFRHEAEREMTGAVGLRRVPKQFIEEYEIPLCSLEEQQRIVEEIESRLSVCDKLEETINASLKQAEALRQSILKQAFEGKLVAHEVAQIT